MKVPRSPGLERLQALRSAPPRSSARASGSGRRAGRAWDRRAWRRSAPRAPRRARARAPRPPRARGPTARRGSRPGTARAAGGGGSPRARRAGRRRSARRRGSGWCSTSPSSPSRLTMPEADAGVTPSRSASALVLTGLAVARARARRSPWRSPRSPRRCLPSGVLVRHDRNYGTPKFEFWQGASTMPGLAMFWA